jgi:hypothetical protein
MKKIIYLSIALTGFYGSAQEHFSGINTSKRVGILNATINPAELNNIEGTYEVNVFNFSINASNNKISFQEILNGEDVENKFFTGSEPASFRLDAIIQGPAFAMKYKKWGFLINTAANIKANAIDVDVNFGDALTNSFIGTAQINSNYNQRMNAVTWGEMGFGASRTIFENDMHKFNAGATFKLLFPGSYMNLGVDQLTGDVTNIAGNVELSNANANVNISYSGGLADNYTDSSNYSQLFAGGLNGFGVDFGFNYQLKEKMNDNVDASSKSKSDYVLNTGLSIRNIGAMKFKSDNNVSNNYTLEIQGFDSLNLNQFDGSESITEIEDVLISSGFLTKTSSTEDFKVKLPTVINAYADYHIHNKWYVSGYIQQKISDDSENNFTTIQNIYTLTPRFSGKNYEIYMPLSQNEISDFTTGFGFRLGGFFMGSGSIVTALINDSTQADVYLGFRFAL